LTGRSIPQARSFFSQPRTASGSKQNWLVMLTFSRCALAAAIYVAQVEDDRLADVNADRRYVDATREVLQQHGGLWFYDESFVISRRRE